MEQTALNFAYPPNPYRVETQNHVLYERLKRGPLLLSELHRSLGMDTARIRDVRKMLKEWGYTVSCRIIEQGETEYSIH